MHYPSPGARNQPARFVSCGSVNTRCNPARVLAGLIRHLTSLARLTRLHATAPDQPVHTRPYLATRAATPARVQLQAATNLLLA